MAYLKQDKFFDGKIMCEVFVNDDKKDGIYRLYHENENLHIECNYINNQINGKYISYHDNGNPYIICYYINGKKFGEYISFYKNGSICEKIYYDNDIIVQNKL